MLYDYLLFSKCKFFIIISIQFCDKHIFKNCYVKKSICFTFSKTHIQHTTWIDSVTCWGIEDTPLIIRTNVYRLAITKDLALLLRKKSH